MNSTIKILCSKCKQFYGTQETKGFCSVCYKTEVKSENVEVKKEEQIIIQEIKEDLNIEQKEMPKQINIDQCWKCQKKVGYLGFTCKCSYIFCGVHRHFTEHNCNYDYKTIEREKLKKENPIIAKKKV